MSRLAAVGFRWPRDRWERAIVLGTAVAIGVALAAAAGTLRARAGVHQAAILGLTGYAAVGMEQFVNGYEARIRQSFLPILPPPDDVGSAGPRDPRPLAGMIERMARLERDPCGCLVSPGPSALFRLGRDSADWEAVDSLGRPLPGLDPEVALAVRRQADSLALLAWGYGFLVTATDQGPQFVVFTHRADSAAGRSDVYGFAMPASHLAERIFRPVFESVPLVPPHLRSVVSRNDELLSLELVTGEDVPLFATAPAYPDGPADALHLPSLRGGMVVRAHLNPALKDALLPGGIPPRVPVREVGLIALSLALLLAIASLGLRAGDLARLRSDLTSSLTHELRTPLTQIRLAAETVMLGRSKSPEAERRTLASIVDETKRLQQLVDNVLHFSHAERRLTHVRVEPVELRPVVERAVGDLTPLVADRSIALRVDVPDELVVRGNASALRQIVLNLVDNAARYGPDRQTITVGAARKDGHVELRVDDAGPGVPLADRERVWRAFVRLDRDRDSAVTGSGLGLAVVRELVVAQGGRCWIEGAPERGARVVVRLAAGAPA